MDEVIQAISYGSLLGARGNSGVIASQILRGFAESLRGAQRLTPRRLARALQEGARMGYRAVTEPVEGTILTVARALAQGAQRLRHPAGLAEVLESALQEGRRALEETPKLLPLLQQAGVVDAGGAGFIRIIEGLEGYIRGLPLPQAVSPERRAQEAFETDHFGYCTEFLLQGSQISLDQLQHQLTPFGRSLLLVESGALIKGHIHTDQPDQLLALLGRYGQLLQTKVEDMTQQHREILQAAQPTPQPTGLVAIVMGEGPARVFRSLGARVVGGGRTANPSVEEVKEVLQSLPNPQAILLPNHPNTLLVCQKAIELLQRPQVHLLPTRTLGAGLAAAVRFVPQLPLSELLPSMERAAQGAVTLEVTWASREVRIQEHLLRPGSPLGLRDGFPLLGGQSPEEVLFRLIEESAAGHEALTLFGDLPETIRAQLQDRFPGLNLEVFEDPPELDRYLAVLD